MKPPTTHTETPAEFVVSLAIQELETRMECAAHVNERQDVLDALKVVVDAAPVLLASNRILEALEAMMEAVRQGGTGMARAAGMAQAAVALARTPYRRNQ
jgi:hypothetical protein